MFRTVSKIDLRYSLTDTKKYWVVVKIYGSQRYV